MQHRKSLLLLVGLLAISVSALADDDRRYQTSDVIDVTGANTFYQGAAWLIRSEDEIEGRIMTKVSTAGDPYTLWVVVFNYPDQCEDDGCGEDDLMYRAEAVGAAVFNGSGAISAADGGLKRNGKPAGGGVINLDFEIEAGGLPNGLFVLFAAGDGVDGLADENGFDAEVHLVVDRHPPIPDGMSWISDLTTTNFPGAGPATNDSVAVFLGCPEDSCPGSVFSP